MALPFVDRATSSLPVQFVAGPQWRSWLKEQGTASRGCSSHWVLPVPQAISP